MARYNAMLDTESTMYNRTVGLSGHERATTPGRRLLPARAVNVWCSRSVSWLYNAVAPG